jgi:hypothetical protein
VKTSRKSGFSWVSNVVHVFGNQWRHANRQGRPLGQERKWLNRYDFMSSSHHASERSDGDMERQSTAETGHLKDIFDAVLENANKILAAASTDPRSIAEATKLAATDAAFESDEDRLESLRWYAYPKESADILVKRIVHPPPATKVPLGALRPGVTKGGREELPSLPVSVSGNIDPCSTEHTETSRGSDLILSFDEPLTKRPKLSFSEKKSLRNESTWGKGSSFTSCAAASTEQSALFEENEEDNKEAPVEVSDRVPCVELGSVDGCASELPAEMPPSTAPASVLAPGGNTIRHVRPPPKLLRLVTQAVYQWEMLTNGDRLLLGLSGGKDSLSLLHCLLELKKKLPIRFDIEVCTVDPMTTSFDPSPLIPYVQSLGLKYHYVRDNIVDRARSSGEQGKEVSSLCAYCARMKRGKNPPRTRHLGSPGTYAIVFSRYPLPHSPRKQLQQTCASATSG